MRIEYVLLRGSQTLCAAQISHDEAYAHQDSSQSTTCEGASTPLAFFGRTCACGRASDTPQTGSELMIPLYENQQCGGNRLWVPDALVLCPLCGFKIRKLRLIGKWNRKIGKSDFPSLYRVSKSRVCLMRTIQVPRC